LCRLHLPLPLLLHRRSLQSSPWSKPLRKLLPGPPRCIRSPLRSARVLRRRRRLLHQHPARPLPRLAMRCATTLRFLRQRLPQPIRSPPAQPRLPAATKLRRRRPPHSLRPHPLRHPTILRTLSAASSAGSLADTDLWLGRRNTIDDCNRVSRHPGGRMASASGRTRPCGWFSAECRAWAAECSRSSRGSRRRWCRACPATAG